MKSHANSGSGVGEYSGEILVASEVIVVINSGDCGVSVD